ncbi:MAG: hypothetical protein NC117_04645 [Pseudoflavonifractor sp.]|nr:hypothetical protein [Pseudoflavonifractor sp.]
MLLVLVSSCTKDEVSRDGSHGAVDFVEPVPDDFYDVPDADLADDTPRLSSDDLSLRYGVPGIMLLSADEPVCDYEIRNIDNGHYVRFSSDGIQGNSLINPAIEIDGERLQLRGLAIVHQESRVWWIVAETLSGNRLLVVVSDISL